MGKADDVKHSRAREERAYPVISLDYAYLSSTQEADDLAAEAEGQSPLLVMRDNRGRGIYPYVMEAKGVDHRSLDAARSKATTNRLLSLSSGQSGAA